MATVVNGDCELILDRMEDSGSFSSEFTFLELSRQKSLVVPLRTLTLTTGFTAVGQALALERPEVALIGWTALSEMSSRHDPDPFFWNWCRSSANADKN
jgi:hypothetical protein